MSSISLSDCRCMTWRCGHTYAQGTLRTNNQHNQQPTTNNQQPTTNNQQPTTNSQQQLQLNNYNSTTATTTTTTTIQQFNNSTIQRFNDSTIQQFNDSTIQQFNNSTIQQFNNSTIQQFNNNNNNTIWGGSVLTGEPPPHSGELKHALLQAGGPTQSQLSRPMSSGHHISMEHRLRRKQLNSDTNASN